MTRSRRTLRVGTDPAPLPRWLVLTIVTGAALSLAGAIIALADPALLIGPGAKIDDGARVYVHYMASRNTALGLLLLTGLTAHGHHLLAGVLPLVTVVQLLDTLFDIGDQRWGVAALAAVLTTAFLTATIAAARRRRSAPVAAAVG